MPKTAKKGFSYFRFETDHFYDPKVRKLKNKFGMEGWAVFHFIVNEIYRVEGCYMAVDPDALFDISDYSRIKEERISQIIDYCADLSLFDGKLWRERQILTSVEIQELYVGICKAIHRKPSIPQDISLLTEPETSTGPFAPAYSPDKEAGTHECGMLVPLPEKDAGTAREMAGTQLPAASGMPSEDIRENKPHKIKENKISSPTPPQVAEKNEEDFLSRELKYMGVPSGYINWTILLKGYYPDLPVEKAIENIKGSSYRLTTSNYLLPLIDNYIAKYNAEYGQPFHERKQDETARERCKTLELLGVPAKVRQEILQLGAIAPLVLDTALKETWGNRKIKSPTRFILSRMRQAVPA